MACNLWTSCMVLPNLTWDKICVELIHPLFSSEVYLCSHLDKCVPHEYRQLVEFRFLTMNSSMDHFFLVNCVGRKRCLTVITLYPKSRSPQDIFPMKLHIFRKKSPKKFWKIDKISPSILYELFSLKIGICYFGEYLIAFLCFVFRCSTDMRWRNKDKRWFHLTFCFDHSFQYFICLLCSVIFHVIKCIKQTVCLYFSGINSKFPNIYHNRVVNWDSINNSFYVDYAIVH